MRGHLVDLTPLRISSQFRRLFVGRSISDFGDEIVAVVLPFQVFQLTDSNFAVGMLGLAQLIPVFVFPIVGGAFADALERRRLLTITYALLAAMSIAMAFNASLPEPMLWPLYAFAFLSAGMYTFNRPALDTWPARLLDPELLPSSNALDAGFGTAIGVLGPVAAGVALAIVAPAGAFLFDAPTFIAVIAAIPPHEGVAAFRRRQRGQLGGDQGRVPVPQGEAHDPVGVPGRPQRDDLRVPDGVAAGGRALARPREGGADPRSPVRGARRRRVPRDPPVGPRERGSAPGRAIMLAIVVWGAAIVVFGLSKSLWLSLGMLAIAGAGDMVSGIFRQTIMQAAVEDRYRGRLGGISMAVWATGPSLGDVESGVVASLTTVPVSIVSGGLICLAGIGMLRWFSPGFWRYDAKHPTL
jgi:MFS family permease